MKRYSLPSLCADLSAVTVTPELSPGEAMRCLRLLGRFNGCLVGLVRFRGQTAWECHPEGDEILHILEGETEMTQLTAGGETRLRARAGDVVQIPQGMWHTQRTLSPVTLFFVTPEGTQASPQVPRL